MDSKLIINEAAGGIKPATRVAESLEVTGAPVMGVLSASDRVIDPNSVIKELNEIIAQKNTIIEQQTEYISELQNDNYNLRDAVKMLTL